MQPWYVLSAEKVQMQKSWKSRCRRTVVKIAVVGPEFYGLKRPIVDCVSSGTSETVCRTFLYAVRRADRKKTTKHLLAVLDHCVDRSALVRSAHDDSLVVGRSSDATSVSQLFESTVNSISFD